jgi:hypothetical protein
MFTFTMEINNRRKGTRTVEIISSMISWDAFEERMGEVLNMYPKSLRLQYRLSTDSPKCLPFDLTSQQQLNAMITHLRPLIVPPLLASGQRSTRKMKPISVQVFNKDDEPGDDKVCGALHFCII